MTDAAATCPGWTIDGGCPDLENCAVHNPDARRWHEQRIEIANRPERTPEELRAHQALLDSIRFDPPPTGDEV